MPMPASASKRRSRACRQLFFQVSAGVLYGYKEPYEDKVPFNHHGISPGVVGAVGWEFTRDGLGTGQHPRRLGAHVPAVVRSALSSSRSVRATTFVARRRSSSSRCSSARLAFDSSTVRGPGAVDRRRDAGFAVEAHVGVERRSRDRDRLAEHRLAVLLQRGDERAVARQRRERAREQQAPDVDRDARPARRGVVDHLAAGSPRPRPGPPRESCAGRASARPCPGRRWCWCRPRSCRR